MNLSFSFPVTLEAFIAYQTELTGCAIPANMKVAIEVWLPAINDAYRSGLKSDYGDLEESIRFLEDLIKKNEAEQFAADFLRKTCYWMAEAWDHGCKDAKKGAVHK